MDIMTAKVDKEIRNGANRAMNCDMANVNKTLDAAQEQTAAIAKLRDSARWFAPCLLYTSSGSRASPCPKAIGIFHGEREGRCHIAGNSGIF